MNYLVNMIDYDHPTRSHIRKHDLVSQLADCGVSVSVIIIHGEEGILANLKSSTGSIQFYWSSTDREFNAILNHLAKGNVFEKSKTLRDRFQLNRDNGDSFYVRFFNNEDCSQNRYQITSQVSQEGTYKNRYDVTILVNGLPLVQIELKRRGLELKEAFNQINRYKRHSFWTNSGLYQYVQLFVISNGVNTKYYVNNPLTTLSFKQTFYWADVHNKNITDLAEFAEAFLNPDHLGEDALALCGTQ
jgi:type I restriction enzyme R subunit